MKKHHPKIDTPAEATGGTATDVPALLDAHYEAFFRAKPYADKTDHPVPSDTRAWSQILVSVLTGIKGRERKKGTDLLDGSDVKGANCWSAIDTPRFNGAIPAGRKSKTARRAPDISALDDIPYIFFVLWDDDTEGHPRCRVWCVRPGQDKIFRAMCEKWYRSGTMVRRGDKSSATISNCTRQDTGTTTCSITNVAISRTHGYSVRFAVTRVSR